MMAVRNSSHSELNPRSSPGHHRDDELRHRHARSASLPCPSHPAVSHLRHQIQSLRHFPHPDERTVVGLAAISRLHAALDDLLRVTLASDPLPCSRATWIDRPLDDLIRLVDAHNRLRSAVLVLKQHQSETRSAIRRRDPRRLSAAARALRCAEKELSRLASAVRGVGRQHQPATDEADIAVFIREALAATAMVSASVFAGLAAMSSDTAAVAAGTFAWKGWPIVGAVRRLSSTKKWSEEEEEIEVMALAKLDSWEKNVEELEKGSEGAFRCLVNSIVLLLNICTPAF